MGGEVDFLPADKHESFQQDDSISVVVHTQACPNCPKHQVCNTLQYPKENKMDEINFLPADKLQRFIQIDCCLSKTTSLLLVTIA